MFSVSLSLSIRNSKLYSIRIPVHIKSSCFLSYSTDRPTELKMYAKSIVVYNSLIILENAEHRTISNRHPPSHLTVNSSSFISVSRMERICHTWRSYGSSSFWLLLLRAIHFIRLCDFYVCSGRSIVLSHA